MEKLIGRLNIFQSLGLPDGEIGVICSGALKLRGVNIKRYGEEEEKSDLDVLATKHAFDDILVPEYGETVKHTSLGSFPVVLISDGEHEEAIEISRGTNEWGEGLFPHPNEFILEGDDAEIEGVRGKVRIAPVYPIKTMKETMNRGDKDPRDVEAINWWEQNGKPGLDGVVFLPRGGNKKPEAPRLFFPGVEFATVNNTRVVTAVEGTRGRGNMRGLPTMPVGELQASVEGNVQTLRGRQLVLAA